MTKPGDYVRCPSCSALVSLTHHGDLYCRDCGLCAPESVLEQLATRLRFLERDRDEVLEVMRAIRRALGVDGYLEHGELVELVRNRCRREEVEP
jgi:hypothetical protein